MFKPKIEKIKMLGGLFPERVNELESILIGKTKVYIDYANVRPWSYKLKWNVDIVRVKQFFDSFDSVESVRLYHGLLEGDSRSEEENKKFIKHYGLDYITKKVKILKKSIDVSSISKNSPDILKNFIRNSLLLELKIQTIELLNDELRILNKRGVVYLEDRKCNFDVEIGMDMYMDLERNTCDCFILWSADSDFAEPIEKILEHGKKVYLFATTGVVSRELSDLRQKGLKIYDIKKIRDFICWKREISVSF